MKDDPAQDHRLKFGQHILDTIRATGDLSTNISTLRSSWRQHNAASKKDWRYFEIPPAASGSI